MDWTLSRQNDCLEETDAVFLPVDMHNPYLGSKSENRLLTALSFKKPVVTNSDERVSEFSPWTFSMDAEGLRQAFTVKPDPEMLAQSDIILEKFALEHCATLGGPSLRGLQHARLKSDCRMNPLHPSIRASSLPTCFRISIPYALSSRLLLQSVRKQAFCCAMMIALKPFPRRS